MAQTSWSNSRALVLALSVVLLAVLGCSSAPSSDQPTTKVPVVEDATKDVNPKGKRWDGWRWEGDRDNCYFKFKNHCFGTREDACKAAECGDKECLIAATGAPAVVSCQQ